MGGRNMFTVMKSLEMADVRVPWKKGKSQAGGQKFRRMGPSELLLLLTVASRQRDETVDYPDEECICYGDVGTMCDISRIKRSSLFDIRNFLVKSGLITFDVNGGSYLDTADPSRKRRYTNVWKLNKDKLAWIAANAPRLESIKTPSESREAAEMGDGQVHETDAQVRQMDSSVQHTDSAVHHTDSAVHHTDSAVQQVDTNIKDNTTLINNNKNSGRKNRGVVGVVEKEGLDYVKAKTYRQYIIDRYNLASDDPNTDQPLVLDNIAKATAGKDPSAVKQVIDEHREYQHLLPSSYGVWVGRLINRLKEIPRTDSEDMPFEQLQAQFSTPQRIMKLESERKEGVYNECWKELIDGLQLRANLNEDAVRELMAKYKKVMNKCYCYIDAAAHKLLYDVTCYDYKQHSFEEMCADKTVDQRIQAVSAVLDEFLVSQPCE